MKPVTRALIDQSRPFEIDELFFSTTNPKGIIETGNDIFVRLSGYARGELVSEPHSVIRHPHMPRGAFQLLWTSLLAGKPIAVYVKNLAKDGRYYWVLAFVAPLKTGFLSVRMKPSSPVYALVQQIYRDMVTLEEKLISEGQPPKAAQEASLALLDQALHSSGYQGYDDFMTRALIPAELKARTAALSTQEHQLALARAQERRDTLPSELSGPIRGVRAGMFQLREANDQFGAVLERAFATITGTRKLLDGFKGLELSAVNVSLRAARLGRSGRATMAIATFLSQATEKFRKELDVLVKELDDARTSLGGLVMEMGWSSLESEMALAATDERLASTTLEELEGHHLGLGRLREGLTETVSRLEARSVAFRDAMLRSARRANALRQAALSLEAAYTGGRVESARLPSSSKLAELLDDLGKRLATVHEAVETTQAAAGDLALVDKLSEKAQSALTHTAEQMETLLAALRLDAMRVRQKAA